MGNKTREFLPWVTRPWLALLLTWSSAMPVCSGFLPLLKIGGLARQQFKVSAIHICSHMFLDAPKGD